MSACLPDWGALTLAASSHIAFSPRVPRRAATLSGGDSALLRSMPSWHTWAKSWPSLIW